MLRDSYSLLIGAFRDKNPFPFFYLVFYVILYRCPVSALKGATCFINTFLAINFSGNTSFLDIVRKILENCFFFVFRPLCSRNCFCKKMGILLNFLKLKRTTHQWRINSWEQQFNKEHVQYHIYNLAVCHYIVIITK